MHITVHVNVKHKQSLCTPCPCAVKPMLCFCSKVWSACSRAFLVNSSHKGLQFSFRCIVRGRVNERRMEVRCLQHSFCLNRTFVVVA